MNVIWILKWSTLTTEESVQDGTTRSVHILTLAQQLTCLLQQEMRKQYDTIQGSVTRKQKQSTAFPQDFSNFSH